jgi:hypothetical protein
VDKWLTGDIESMAALAVALFTKLGKTSNSTYLVGSRGGGAAGERTDGGMHLVVALVGVEM